jgi:hypothetical protein
MTSHELAALKQLEVLLDEVDSLEPERAPLVIFANSVYRTRAAVILADLPGPAVDEEIYGEYRELMRACGAVRPTSLERETTDL